MRQCCYRPSARASANRSSRHAANSLTRSIRGSISSGEIRAVLEQRTGDVVLTYASGVLDSFAVCLNGPGSEGGQKTCYIKFGAARGGAGAGERFDKLLDACEAFASLRGATVEAGVNLAREDAYRRLRSHGYRAIMQGVAMQRPHAEGFNRADVYVIDDPPIGPAGLHPACPQVQGAAPLMVPILSAAAGGIPARTSACSSLCDPKPDQSSPQLG